MFFAIFMSFWGKSHTTAFAMLLEQLLMVKFSLLRATALEESTKITGGHSYMYFILGFFMLPLSLLAAVYGPQ